MKRDTILIFEDNTIEREILAELFRGEYKILEAENGKKGIELLNSNFQSIAVVLIDNMMPVMDGFEVMKFLKEKNVMNKIPFIMITGQDSWEFEKRGYEYGIVSYIKKPYQAEVIKQVVSNAVGWFHYKMQLEVVVKKQNDNIQKQNDRLKKQAKKLSQLNEILIDSLSNIVEFRNLESKQHIKRVREFVQCLGKSIIKLYPEYELTPEKLDQISWASSLHDIGKIALPDNIILKSGRLTEDEFELIKSHTTKGEEIISQAIQLNDKNIFDYACDIARHHHEKYDGNGYPDGLKGDEISIAAQIVSLVDVYDALTSKRVYKDAYEPDRAYQMIINGHTGTFSPKLLKAFTEVRAEFEKLLVLYRDEE
ncbi:MAG: response regulator [Lachnospiraceae bacterium]|nr:response regulator [Lachnospiraceae bacterium]